MDFIKIRQYLHQHPETSDNEKETAIFINQKLKQIGIEKIENNFFEAGILAKIDSGKPGKTILFRAELDALPIQEINEDLPYKSTVDGVSHKCGHDGHMTILLGLAERLINDKPKEGKILLLFQPSEENGRGAEGIIASKILENYSIDFVFALHNIPGYPLGSVICKPGSFTPSVESLDIKMIGKTSHAGMPEKGVNPSEAIAGLIRFYNDLHQPDVEKEDYFLSSPVQIRMGEPAYGTAAGDGLISYTFRSFDYKFFKKQK
ncbi:MAG TPA: M20 family metallopeptidase, partial [Flavobacteriaceae bacterium]|nr:M20 family metallopeptidase [Flavobacteriaceae bacterium]